MLANQGGGTFGAPTVYATQVNPKAIVAGELDGDGDLDLINANYSSSSLNVFFGDTGTSFQEAGPVATELRRGRITRTRCATDAGSRPRPLVCP